MPLPKNGVALDGYMNNITCLSLVCSPKLTFSRRACHVGGLREDLNLHNCASQGPNGRNGQHLH